MVFCFDTKPYKRSEIYADYKRKGNPKSEEELDDLLECFRQVGLLRNEILRDLGYANVFWSVGYEADDIIASIEREALVPLTPEIPKLIAVSTDKDLYQLLGWKLDIWNPATNKIYDTKSMVSEWKIAPDYWSKVKAIAGCKTDNITGIKGVKEKTAIKYILGDLKKSSQAFQRISVGPEIIERNLKLTTLPFLGTPRFEINEDNVTAKRWKGVMTNLELKTLINTCPVAARRF